MFGGDPASGVIRHRGIWRRFFHTCRMAHLPWGLLVFYILLSVLQSNILIKLPQVSGNFFSGDASVESVSLFIGIELLITVLVQVVLYVDHILRYRMNRNLRNALWGKILRLRPRYFDRVSASALLSRITVDADAMNEFVMDIVLMLFTQLYTLYLTIREMSAISIRAGLLLLVFIPLSILVSFVMGRLNLKFQSALKQRMSGMTDYLSELVSSLPLLKAMNRQGYERRRGRAVIDDYYRENARVVGLDFVKQVVDAVVSIGPEVCILLIGIQLLNDGTFDGAAWYMFYVYAGTFIGFANTLGGLFQRTKSVQGQLNRVSDILYEEDESVEVLVQDIVASGDVSFDRVSFGYEEGKPVLKDVSVTIPRNKNTAVIGMSGAGKSTLLKLFERIYEPTQGSILAGGQPISRYGIRDWRSHLAYVSQATPLMSGTIRENLCYGIKREVSDEELMEAARLCHVDGFIASQPEGLDYQVGQFGGKLSGGQRQKLSIARAVLTGAEFLILDEPTAALDILSTDEITRAIESLRGTRTIIIVTHDARVVRTADHVISVETDHTVFEGTGQELSLVSDFYRQLVKA